MKEATDEHGFPRMTLFWHSQNSVIHSEEWLVPPAFGVPNAGWSVTIRGLLTKLATPLTYSYQSSSNQRANKA